MTALKQARPRPRLDDVDRAFWVALRHSWSGWTNRLLIVNPDTVTRWHRDRFRRSWARISQRRQPGRPRVDVKIRRLIRRMARDGWGAPRIHAELTKLGVNLAEKTVSRYMPRRPTDPDRVKRCVAFLRNHKDDIAAMDLFTVPTASLRLLYGFFVIEHGRRRIVHFNATFHPTSAWVMQQLREAFPYDTAPRYLIFDRDSTLRRELLDHTSSCSANGILSTSCADTSATTTRTAATWGSTRTCRMSERSRHVHHPRRRSSRCRGSVDCTIGTSGARLRSNLFRRLRWRALASWGVSIVTTHIGVISPVSTVVSSWLPAWRDCRPVGSVPGRF